MLKTSSQMNSNAELLSRSEEFEAIVMNTAMDSDSIVRSEIHFEELRPLVDTDIPSDAFCHKDSSLAGFYSYEDAGISTGMFLASQSLRYKVTGDALALDNAQRAFEGIKFVYNLGKEKTEGFFPKPYDKKFSHQISRDQYLFVMTGMKEFHSITDTHTQKEIEKMMGKMARYWCEIQYSPTYFSMPATSHLYDFMGSLFLGIIRMGYEFTKDPFLLDEYQRLLTDESLGERMQETLRSQFLQGKKYDGGMYFRQHEHSLTMKTVAIDYLWDYDPKHQLLWSQALKAFWEDDLRVGFDPEDGLSYFIIRFDQEHNSTSPVNSGIIPELEAPLNISSLNWGGHHKTAISSQLAYCAVIIADRLQDNSAASAASIAKSILEKLDLEKFRGYTVPDDSHIPPGELYKKNILSLNFLNAWLWTYWTGREKKFW